MGPSYLLFKSVCNLEAVIIFSCCEITYSWKSWEAMEWGLQLKAGSVQPVIYGAKFIFFSD